MYGPWLLEYMEGSGDVVWHWDVGIFCAQTAPAHFISGQSIWLLID